MNFLGHLLKLGVSSSMRSEVPVQELVEERIAAGGQGREEKR